MNKGLLKSNYIYFTGLLLLVASLPLSLFLTSISQFILSVAFLFEGNFIEKFKRFFRNKPAMLLAGIWILHLIGLLWTTDMNEGIKDLRIKLPLLILPLIIGGSLPLTKIQFRWILIVFVSAIVCSSFISIAVLAGIIKRNIYDIRDIFIFNISHIRFALFVCLSIFMLIWLAFIERKNVQIKYKIIALITVCWLLVFLVIAESVTGLLIFSVTGFLLLLYYAFTSARLGVRILLVTGIIIVPFAFIITLDKFVKDFYENHPYPINTNDKTSLGNEYLFNLKDPLYENGYPVWVYVCDEELRTTWNKLSNIPYDSTDERNQPLKFTLIRFLASKGLKKDAEGLMKLNLKEQRSVERGIANVNYQDISSIHSRLLQIMWEFDQFVKGGNPSGHSVTQRFEFWKAGWNIASSNLMTGVGTGDMPSEYQRQYVSMKSTLDEKHRLRAHNQYLAIMVAFGVFGLAYFIFALIYPIFFSKEKIGFLFASFFLISLCSMLSEDTLETQPGATFIAMFYSLLLFAKPK
jgi:hypothetical protein